MAFEEDIPDLLDVNEFAVSGTFGAHTAAGILERGYAEAFDTAGYRPIWLVAAADADAIALNAEGTIDGTAYAVREKQPDGTGLVNLVLEELS